MAEEAAEAEASEEFAADEAAEAEELAEAAEAEKLAVEVAEAEEQLRAAEEKLQAGDAAEENADPEPWVEDCEGRPGPEPASHQADDAPAEAASTKAAEGVLPPAKRARASAEDVSACANAEREKLMDRLSELAKGLDVEQLVELVAEVERLQAERSARQPALMKQMAFYFSDANLRRDWYLRDKMAEDSDGWVPLSFLVPFNRLRVLGCTSVSELAAAVEAAPASACIELSSDRCAVRRGGGDPLPAIAEAGGGGAPSAQDKRSVQIQGFPKGDESVTVEAVSALCAPFGEVAYVRLLRDRYAPTLPNGQRPFMGSAELEFETEAAAAAAASADQPLSWQGQTLAVKVLSEVRARDGGNAGKRTRAGSDLEEEREAKRSCVEGEAAALAARMDRGVTLRLAGVPSGVTWRHIYDALSEYGGVVFVDHEGKGESAYARMRSTDGTELALEAAARLGGFLEVTAPVKKASAVQDTQGGTEDTQTVEACPSGAAEAEGQAVACAEEGASSEGARDEGAKAPAPADAPPPAAPAPGEGPRTDADAVETDPYAVTDEAGAAAQERPPAEAPVPGASTEQGGTASAAVESDPYGVAEEATATPAATEPAPAAQATAKTDPYAASEEATPASAAQEPPTDASTQDGAAPEAAVPGEGDASVGDRGTADAATSDDGAVAEETAGEGIAPPHATERTVRIAVVQVLGDEEETYIRKVALGKAEWRKGQKGKGFKGEKGDKGGKGGKDFKGGKNSKGKGKKGGKGGKKGARGGKQQPDEELDDS